MDAELVLALAVGVVDCVDFVCKRRFDEGEGDDAP